MVRPFFCLKVRTWEFLLPLGSCFGYFQSLILASKPVHDNCLARLNLSECREKECKKGQVIGPQSSW